MIHQKDKQTTKNIVAKELFLAILIYTAVISANGFGKWLVWDVIGS